MDTVTVIIPMYNAEKYIRQCIHSVTSQTYQSLEIVVIDDGSTDCSREICEELSSTDDRIQLYHHENGGVSRARNYGLDVATGEYIFFLDSDDAVYPRLFEEMIRVMDEQGAEMAFCSYRKLESCQMEEALREMSFEGKRMQWRTADGVETEEWLHRKYKKEFSGIGGKMVRRELVKGLRFEEGVSNGEDTLFIYQIACRQIRVVFSPEKWYYYRMHSASATHVAALKGKCCFESSRRIRDSEYQREHTDYALAWEILMVRQIEMSYLVLKNRKDRAGCDELREIAREERKHPLYHCIYPDIRMLFVSCFCCLPLYYLLKWLFSVYSGWKERGNNDEQSKS